MSYQPAEDLERIVSVMQDQYEQLEWALGQMEAAEDSKVREYWATGPVDGAAKGMAWQCRLHWSTIRAALERADEVADQGCELCDSMVTDLGPEGESHGHFWICGECWNKSAIETSTEIKRLKDVIARMDREVEGHIELIVETQRRERELREALEELVRGSGLLALSEYWAAVSRAKALLAQPAAGEERGDG